MVNIKVENGNNEIQEKSSLFISTWRYWIHAKDRFMLTKRTHKKAERLDSLSFIRILLGFCSNFFLRKRQNFYSQIVTRLRRLYVKNVARLLFLQKSRSIDIVFFISVLHDWVVCFCYIWKWVFIWFVFETLLFWNISTS